jgi:hypothetical protein
LNELKTISPRNTFTSLSRHAMAMALVAALATVSSLAAMAQTSSTPAAPVISPEPLALAAAPATFAAYSASAPLDLPRVEVAANAFSSSAELPEAPIAQPAIANFPSGQTNGTPAAATTAGPVATIYTKYIPAGWHAQHLTAQDKVVLGLRDTYSPLNFTAMIVSAGYEQVLNGEPNYGVDRGAFGERLGAAAIRETTQGVFTDSVFSPLLHEDPRYYVEGSQYSFIHRVLYAGTRPLITRTDNGHSSVNGALLLGYAASSALTYSYYPAINQNFHDTASTFGGAIGGAALGFLINEFSSDIWTTLHLQKKR